MKTPDAVDFSDQAVRAGQSGRLSECTGTLGLDLPQLAIMEKMSYNYVLMPPIW